MDEDLRSASQSMNNDVEKPAYAPQLVKKPHKSLKLPLIILGVLIVLAAAGFAGWNIFLNKPADTPVPSTPKAETPKVISDAPSAQATETYSSSALSVSFKYPKTWKISEATGGIRIESPDFTYRSISAGDIAGNFRVYIRQGSRNVDGVYIGKGIAIKTSDKLVYTQPAPGQRADTLLSFFGENGIDNFSFFLIAGNFQLALGDTLGPDYGKEPDTYIVAGGYSSTSAVDDLATIPVSTDYYATTNAYKQAVAIIASLQLK